MPNSFAAKSRIAFLFIVKLTALALGTTCIPSFSYWIRRSVRIASISAIMTSGLCLYTTASRALASNMLNTSLSSATCIAGALS